MSKSFQFILFLVFLVVLLFYAHPLIYLLYLFRDSDGFRMLSPSLSHVVAGYSADDLALRDLSHLLTALISGAGLSLLLVARQRRGRLVASIASVSLLLGLIGVSLFLYYGVGPIRGDLNQEYGKDTGDKIVRLSATYLREFFGILATLMGVTGGHAMKRGDQK